MSKYTWKDMEELHEKLMEYRSYKDNSLRLIPGGDGKTIMLIRRKTFKLADDNFVAVSEVIDEFDTYDELAAFMAGVTFMYYEGVTCDD